MSSNKHDALAADSNSSFIFYVHYTVSSVSSFQVLVVSLKKSALSDKATNAEMTAY